MKEPIDVLAHDLWVHGGEYTYDWAHDAEVFRRQARRHIAVLEAEGFVICERSMLKESADTINAYAEEHLYEAVHRLLHDQHDNARALVVKLREAIGE